MRYDRLIIDVANLAYRVFQHRDERPAAVSKKSVYKNAVCNFIRKVEELKAEHLEADGEVFLLFDNPTSRVDLQASFYFADRKQQYAKYKVDREREPKEFYNSINLLKYYYLTGPACYRTMQISKLEADDLVAPTLRLFCKGKTALMITNDLDWVRYISDTVHWMPKGEPESNEQLSARMGFEVTEQTITAYKGIFGDPADNIPSIAPMAMKESFYELSKIIKDAEDLSYLATKDAMLESYAVLREVAKNERQYRINVQLVKAIDVADSHALAVTTKGRDSAVALRAVQEAVGLISSKNTFTFGNVRRPRIM